MKIHLIAILCAFYLVGCNHAATPVLSPSGDYHAETEISGAEAGPTRHDCVRLVVTNRKTKDIFALQTGASDFQKWAIGWSPHNVLILYSSDIGTYAYDISGSTIKERSPSKEELKTGKEAYHSKYRN